MKRALSLLFAAFLAISLQGCHPTQRFSCDELTMQVPEGMTDVTGTEENAMFHFALESETLFICGIREDFFSVPNGISLSVEDYAQILMEENGMPDVLHAHRAGEDYLFLRFQLPLEDGVHQYLCGIFRASEAFWLIQMDAKTADFNEEQCFGYLDSVKFQ